MSGRGGWDNADGQRKSRDRFQIVKAKSKRRSATFDEQAVAILKLASAATTQNRGAKPEFLPTSRGLYDIPLMLSFRDVPYG